MTDNNAIVLTGASGAITLQAQSLPDVRTILNDEQRAKARAMALRTELTDASVILNFGDNVSMSTIATRIVENTKVREARGSVSEQVLVDLGLLKKKLDPMRILSPKLQTGLLAARRFADAVTAYKQDWDSMAEPLAALKMRLERSRQEEHQAVKTLEELKKDCLTMYEEYTVLEAGLKYLLQRMLQKYDEDKRKLKPGDQGAEDALEDLADMIGMVDRTTFDTHFARARVIVVSKQIKAMRKSNIEMYRMFSSQIKNNLPIFEIQMAESITLVASKKRLDVLKDFTEADLKQAADLDKALGQHVVDVATTSEDNTAAVKQLLSSYMTIQKMNDDLQKIHQDGAKARAELTGQIDAIVSGLSKSVNSYDPRQLLQAPPELKDVDLEIDKNF